ncbi:arylformamidase [Phyllobacterium sp. 1468]|uniref:alpha/beta hydrolase n=1 Tax=Phyllobacterium sp. 1468 TaxID=2817759 RepID=UPI002856CFD0|nr:alpha/beta hydrolase [Phyllobacterium sp. 1468]MDR6634618.1 arylformamidase [Phyllobacterium sp. 1468]
METDPFRIRAHVQDFDTIIAEIVAASSATRHTLPMLADIAYGSDESETLDIFFPEGPRQARPVHIFIHGGYWRMFSKRDYSYVADTITRAGAIAVILDYALMPHVRLEVLVDQVRRARQWVRDHIARYGGDASRLTVSGHSAGAHLASFLFQKQAESSGIAAALLLGGIYDLKPLQQSFLQAEIGLTDQEVAAFSPLSHSHDVHTNLVVAVGSEETPPFHQQADAFTASLQRQGLNVSRETIVNSNHMSSVRDLGRHETVTGGLLSELIERHS